MTDTTKILPKLRFPEFENDGEWKVMKLGEIAQFFKGKGISKAEVSNTGTIPCIRYGELYTYYKEVVRDIKSYTNIPTDNLVLSKANDVIIPSSGETKEDISTASCIIEDGIALGGDINIIRSSANGIFLSYYLNNAKKNDIAKIAQGISIIHLYNEQLQNLSVAIPSLPEQQKTASFLTSLDEQISAHTKKLEALKAHKKGLMQQLFPANGEKTPKLRFPEFKNDGEWEEVRLGEIITAINPPKKLQSCDYRKKGLYPIIDQSQNYICGYTDDNEGLLNKDKDFLIVFGDHTCVLKSVDFPFVQGADGIKIFHSKMIDYVDTIYIYQFLLSKPIVANEYKRHFSELKEIDIVFPHSIQEQHKIASFLTSIDEMIQAQDDKTRKLKTYKNGLMQQLFPQK